MGQMELKLWQSQDQGEVRHLGCKIATHCQGKGGRKSRAGDPMYVCTKCEGQNLSD